MYNSGYFDTRLFFCDITKNTDKQTAIIKKRVEYTTAHPDFFS